MIFADGNQVVLQLSRAGPADSYIIDSIDLKMQPQAKSPDSLIKYETEIEVSQNAQEYKSHKNAGPTLDAKPSP